LPVNLKIRPFAILSRIKMKKEIYLIVRVAEVIAL
jgi:hypothetical protein